MKKTTQQWLTEVKTTPGKLEHWLTRQYVGEALAADRISALANAQADPKHKKVLNHIASDEQRHCVWVAELLAARNIPLPTVTYDGTRYWEPILKNISTFDEIAAIGHHAESMRLVRIKALAADSGIDPDIRAVFANILPDEEFHAKAFANLSTAEAIEATRELHEQGLEMLGLEI